MLNRVDPLEFSVQVFNRFDPEWLLLASGNVKKDDFNLMTIAWGSLGVMWRKPFIQVVVRPQRHTYQYMESFDNFTVSGFSKEYREKLAVLGSKSGRDMDKMHESGLTPTPSKDISSPSFKEADLIFECKKMYVQDMDERGFIQKDINDNYKSGDYHRIYYGEILSIFATEEYKR